MARDGYGDMAVSNAIGSNVFDIDLGLGLPYVISSLIKKGKAVYLLNAKDQVGKTYYFLISLFKTYLSSSVFEVLGTCM